MSRHWKLWKSTGKAIILDVEALETVEKHKHGKVLVTNEGQSLQGRTQEDEGVILGSERIDSEGPTYWEVIIDAYNAVADVPINVGVAARCPDLGRWYYNSPDGWALKCSGKGIESKHQGRSMRKALGPPIKVGMRIGIYIDMDVGTLHLFIDGKYVGEAFNSSSGLKDQKLYPAFHQTMGFRCTLKHIPRDCYPELGSYSNQD